MSYKEFCEQHKFDESRGSEEEYEAAKKSNNGMVYILDSGKGNLVSKIKLSIRTTIDI